MLFQNILDLTTSSMKVTRVKRKDENKWFYRKLIELKKKKIELYLKATNENSEENWRIYKNTRNKYKNLIYRAKNESVQKIIKDNYSDQKKLWKTFKYEVFKEKKSVTTCVVFDNLETRYELEIANKFNSYFVESIQAIADSIPAVNYTSHINEVKEDLFVLKKSEQCRSFKNNKIYE